MPQLSNSEIVNAKSFITGLYNNVTNSNKISNNVSKYFYYNPTARAALKQIYNEIVNRVFNFIDDKLDDALQIISDAGFASGTSGRKIKRPVQQLADYICWFCSNTKLYWDDTTKTTYEMAAYKNTIFGKAVFDWGLFLNNKPTPTASQPAQQKTTSTRQPGQPPQNNYKSTGGQSGNIINLIGQPSVKVYAQGSKVYSIIADKIGKNTPNAFVKPLDSKYQQGTENKVCFGSGNGYTDCRCFFDTMSDAQVFLGYCQTDFGGKFNNMRIQTDKADQNGYFLVRTVYGDCAIKASRMNEELEESLENTEDKKDNLDVYAEWLQKSVC